MRIQRIGSVIQKIAVPIFLFLFFLFASVGYAQSTFQEREIRLHDVLREALRKNLTLRAARLQPDLQKVSVEMESSRFEPRVQMNFNNLDSTRPATSDLAGAPTLEQQTQNWTLQYQQTLSWGTTFTAEFNQTRLKTNSIFYTLNPQFNSTLRFQIVQPLLKGFGPWNAQANLRAAKERVQASHYSLRSSELNLLVQVAQAYWDLAYAYKFLEVQKDALKLAEQLLKDTEKQIELGVKAPIEKTSALAEVATRRQNVVLAEQGVQSATDLLKTLVQTTEELMKHELEIWKPADLPPEPMPPPPLSAFIKKALANHPTLLARKKEIEAAELQYRAARNNLLPTLNVVASYEWNGLGGDRLIYAGSFFNRQIIGVLPGKFTDSINQVLRGDYPTWSVGLQLTLPLQNHQEKAQLLQAEVTLEQARIQFEQERQNVVLNVRNAYRDLVSAYHAYESALATLEMQKKNLEAEQKKLRLGLSTNFVVLQYQNQFAQAQASVFKARTDYAKAGIRLLETTGRLSPEDIVEFQKRLLSP